MKTKITLLLCTFSLAACGTVENGQRGVVLNYGKATSVLNEGFYWYNPWSTDVVYMDTMQQRWASQTDAYTKDVQQATIKFVLSYHLDPSAVLDKYKRVGTEWSSREIPQVAQQSIKNVIGRARAVEDAINNRGVVADQIGREIRTKLAKKGIIVDGFELVDVSFSKTFEAAVERKQVAVQNAETEKNKTVQISEQARQRVISANADAEAMKIKTAALSGNAKLVEYEAVQRWDGKLPQNMYGGGAMPFIGVGR